MFGEAAQASADALVEREALVLRRGLLHHRGRESPHRLVDIRSASGALFAIVDADTGALLGTVDEARAYHDVHPGAVYLHQGTQFEVAELDLARAVAVVERSTAEYYTQPRHTTDLEVLGADLDATVGVVPASFGGVRVIDEVELTLPAQTLVTKALWWLLTPEVLRAGGIGPTLVPGSAHAAEHAAIGLLPLVATCDRWDIGGLSTPLHPDTGEATIFIYDGYPGGAGIAERGHRSGERLLEATLEAVHLCPCARGCPSCIQSPKCGNGNEPLDKRGAVHLLAAMLGREPS
ncbi:MAG: DUF1998 domain-containing protein [Deltaproteobacteria bacterium]|nr:MAG: DUF1998 domain-containing protein [Deltaproteobacteria bacterium]